MLFQQVSDPDAFWRTVADRAKEETLSAFGTKMVTLYLALLVSAVAVALRVLSDGIPKTTEDVLKTAVISLAGPIVGCGVFVFFFVRSASEIYAEQRDRIRDLQLARTPQHQGQALVAHLASLHAEGVQVRNRIVRQGAHWDPALKPVAREWDSKVTAYLQKNVLHMVGRYKSEKFEAVEWLAELQIGHRTKQWAKYMEQRLNNLQSIIERIHENTP